VSLDPVSKELKQRTSDSRIFTVNQLQSFIKDQGKYSFVSLLVANVCEDFSVVEIKRETPLACLKDTLTDCSQKLFILLWMADLLQYA